MLRIFYGRESYEKERHLYEHLAPGGLVVVPEQYTLQAEREALSYLGTAGLLETEIISFSTLGRNILQEAGGGRRPAIDRYGRHMLLSKIMDEVKEDLELYRGYTRSAAFLDLLNDMISQMKQYGVTPEALAEARDALPEEKAYLKTKLAEIGRIYEAYEARIEGKYVDTEDRIDLYAERLRECGSLKGRPVCVYGFDYFTPNNLKFLKAILTHCGDLTVYLTYSDEIGEEDLFGLGSLMIRRLRELAEEAGASFAVERLDETYREKDKTPALSALERNLYALPPRPCEDAEGITLVKAANYYTEAATAAREIRRLVQEEGYRYRDIILICNDLTVRGAICKRVFASYDLDLFLDTKRGITHNPAVVYMVRLLAIAGKGYRTEDVMGLLKTGLTDADRDLTDRLENYCETYFIRGGAFRKPFVKGEEDLEELNAWREAFTGRLESFRKAYREGRTVEEKAAAFYRFLEEEARLPEKLQALVEEQFLAGEPALAQETARIWNVSMDILDQMVAVMGREPISMTAFADLFLAGIEALELGLLPPRADGLVMGTMARTRTGKARAVFVLGAAEGVMPLEGASRDVLTEEEKEYLIERDLELCKMDRLRAMEERLAIYRNLCRATERLYMSYAVSDEGGKEQIPSPVYDTIRELFPALKESPDAESLSDLTDRIGGEDNTLAQLGRALKQEGVTEETAALWQWYEEQEDRGPESLVRAMEFSHRADPVGPETAEALYARTMDGDALVLSPSRLERFGRCPFAHFVRYGLHPEEPDSYQVQAFDMGQVYHELLRRLSERLTDPGVPVTDPASPWMTIGEEDRKALVDRILDETFRKYREGLLSEGGESSYRARRVREAAQITAARMVDQVRQGKTTAMDFEVPFGRGKTLPPVTVTTKDGTDVQIAGVIDRVDWLPGGEVKVVDYKSGPDTYSEAEAKGGWKLQLFLYLKAAEKSGATPVGAFYFHVGDPRIQESKLGKTILKKEGLTAAIEEKLKETFLLNGFLVDRPDTVVNIAGQEPVSSGVLHFNRGAGNTPKPGKNLKLLPEEDFTELVQAVDERVSAMARDLAAGHIDLAPRRITKGQNKQTACKYCGYRHICKFDVQFTDCRYVNID